MKNGKKFAFIPKFFPQICYGYVPIYYEKSFQSGGNYIKAFHNVASATLPRKSTHALLKKASLKKLK